MNGNTKKRGLIIGISAGAAALAAVIAALIFLLPKLTAKKNGASDGIGEISYSAPEAAHIQETLAGFGYVDNELAVTAAAGVSRADMEALAKENGAEVVGCIEKTGDYQWRFDSVKTEEELKALAETLKQKTEIADATLNLCMEGFEASAANAAVPDVNTGTDADWAKSLNSKKTDDGVAWFMKAIDAPRMWSLLNENKDKIRPVAAGVVDSGFDEGHSDLHFRQCFYNKNYETMRDSSDKAERDNAKEAISHGTEVAGCMAADGGIAGVYPYAEEGGLYGADLGNSQQYSENNQNLIVEGCYIPLDWRRDFDERYQPSIRFICLGMTDEYIDAHYEDILRHESEIESRPEVPDCTKERLKTCNRHFINGFRDHGEDVLLISDDYEQTLGTFLEQEAWLDQ